MSTGLRRVSELGDQSAMAAVWTVAQLETHSEHLAERCLALRGYATYAPRIAAARRRVLLFPNYIFVSIVDGKFWNARWAAGVAKLLTNGGNEPAPVADAIIAELRSREGRDGLVRLPRPPGLQRGDCVRIVHGAFAGQLGLFDGMKPHERVAVLLAILGGQRIIELPKADIVRANK